MLNYLIFRGLHFTAATSVMAALVLLAFTVVAAVLAVSVTFTMATTFAMPLTMPVAALMLLAFTVVAAVLAFAMTFAVPVAAAVALAIAVMAAAAGLQEEADAGHKALEAFQQHAAGAGYVKAHEAFSNRTIYRAHRQLEAAVVFEELAKGFAQPFLHLEQPAEIQPHEIRTLERAGNYLRKLVFQETVYGAGILVQICTELIQPLAGSAVCGLQGSDSEHIHVTALVVVDCPVHLGHDSGVFGVDIGNLYACNIERLGRRIAGYRRLYHL